MILDFLSLQVGHVLVLFKGTAHLDFLFSAGFGVQMPAFIFLFIFSFLSAGLDVRVLVLPT